MHHNAEFQQSGMQAHWKGEFAFLLLSELPQMFATSLIPHLTRLLVSGPCLLATCQKRARLQSFNYQYCILPSYNMIATRFLQTLQKFLIDKFACTDCICKSATPFANGVPLSHKSTIHCQFDKMWHHNIGWHSSATSKSTCLLAESSSC